VILVVVGYDNRVQLSYSFPPQRRNDNAAARIRFGAPGRPGVEEQGVIAGYHVQDVVVELFFGKDHPVDSNETAFKTAASRCFKKVFEQARPALLEPIVTMEIVVPGDKLGDITSDLNTRRGRMEGMDNAPGGFQVIRAKAPLAEVMTYARSLSSMTGGQGSYSMEYSHYEMVPPNEQQKIVASAKKVEEED